MSDGQEIFKKTQTENTEAYAPLREVLEWAYAQAAHGKGRTRHANNLPFTQQPILATCRRHGTGFATGQAEKKLGEAMGMVLRGERQPAVQELLGAIVYTAAAVIHLLESSDD